MAFIEITAFKKLKSFFWGLKQKECRYNLEKIPSRDAQGVPIDKEYCLEMLRTFPEFQDEKFKNPKNLIEHFKELSEKGQLKRILDPYTATDQQTEFAEVVKELPEEDPSTQMGPAEQAAASNSSTGESASSMAGQNTGGFGMPSGGGSSPSYNPSRKIITQQVGGRQKGTGSGTAATNKGPAPVSGMRGGTGSGTGAMEKAGFQAPKIPYSVTNSFQNASSGAQIFAKKAGTRLGSGLSNFFKGAGRAGGGAFGSALGAGGNALGRFTSALSKPGIGGVNAKTGRYAAMLLGSLLLMVLVGGLIGAFGGGGSSPTGTSPTGTLISDISQCKFTRSDHNPKDTTFKSNLLLGYIQEAARLGNIPPAVLAAFIRVESPSTSDMTDDQISKYASNCAESKTGALGIMQIQPPGTKSLAGDPASCDDCIDAGAKLVGKTVSTMTRQDYCDPKTSIIVGAGWILKKMDKLGFKNSGAWNPAWTDNKEAISGMVNTYYGCLLYGGARDCEGPYNYADDVSTSIRSCQPTALTTIPGGATSPVPPPAPSDTNELKLAIKNKFKIVFIGDFSPNLLKWAWEVFHQAEYYAPNFYPLLQKAFPEVKVVLSNQTIADNSTGSVLIKSGVYDGSEKLFKQTLIHELGHIIHGTDGGPRNPQWDRDLEQITRSEEFLTGYTKFVKSIDEDFAETVSYYINRGMPEQSTRQGVAAISTNVNPLEGGKYNGHASFAVNLLGKPNEPAIATQPSANPLSIPAAGIISLCYGSTESPYNATNTHKGVDIANDAKTPVFAAAEGTVIETAYTDNNGYYVRLDHPQLGVQTLYLHLLSDFQVKKGDSLSRKALLGNMDSTGYSFGSHLHFAVVKNNQIVNPATSDLLNINCSKGLAVQ